MPKLSLKFYLFFAVSLVGCSSKIDLSNPGTPPPHGGTFLPIPNGTGYVEVVKGKPGGPEVAFYFFKDAKTPFSPGPTFGTLSVSDKFKVTLKAEGDGLVTPSAPPVFKDGEPKGNLFVELEGKKVLIPLGVRE